MKTSSSPDSISSNTKVEVRIILRRLLTTLAVVPLIATVGLLGSASPAGAAEHPITGTYQLFLQGSSAQTLVLLPHHAVGTPFNNGTWSVRKREVTIDVSGGQAPSSPAWSRGRLPLAISTTSSLDSRPRPVLPAKRLPEWQTPTLAQTWWTRSRFGPCAPAEPESPQTVTRVHVGRT